MISCGVALQAFLAASLKSDEELWKWFRERLIWDDPAVVQDLLRNGLFYRIYTPQVRGTPCGRFSVGVGYLPNNCSDKSTEN